MAVIRRNNTKKRINFPKFDAKSKAKSLIQIKPILVLLCVGLMYFAYSNWQSWLEKLDDKPIRSFALLGSPTFTTNADVREMIVKMGELKGFFGQNVDEVREQIQSMPWVKGAVVRKIWPDRLSIMVSEYQPIAYWNGDHFLSSDGAVFQLPIEKLKETNMPRLFGPDYKSAEVLEAWHKIFNELKTKNLTLKSVSIDERGSWEITLDNDILLKLGRGDWKTKIDHFVTIYPQIEIPENKRIAYVDLRYKVGGSVGFTDK